MTIMRDKPGINWVPVALGGLVVAGGLAYWMGTTSGASDSAPAAAVAASAAASPVSEYEALMAKQAAVPAPPPSDAEAPPTPAQMAEMHQAMTDQVKVAQNLERPDIWRPLSGALKERPDYVSAMEWQMLKGVAERHPDPQAELLRLTNFLRYTKLLEKWQDLPSSADAGQRQALAMQLSSELPDRVRNGELETQDALKQATGMLRDAYPDGKARNKAERELAQRIQQAAEQLATSGGK